MSMSKRVNEENSVECQTTPTAKGGGINVSIIIPAYNTGNYIEKCLTSLINQTLKNIEIIVINDGSTDDTAEIVSKFAQQDNRIKLINQEHKKQGASRNKGMELALGEYIGFVDSDDWVDLDYFEKLYNAAKKYNSDIALATNIRTGNGKTKKRLEIKQEKFVTTLQEKIDISNQYKNPCPTNKIYRTAMLKENNIVWEEDCYCEDRMFTIQALYYSNGLVSAPDTYYYYYRNPTSTVNTRTSSHKKKLIEDKNSANLRVLNFLRSKNAQLKDKEFWAITGRKTIFHVPVILKKESMKSARYYLFSVIKILEKAI